MGAEARPALQLPALPCPALLLRNKRGAPPAPTLPRPALHLQEETYRRLRAKRSSSSSRGPAWRRSCSGRGSNCRSMSGFGLTSGWQAFWRYARLGSCSTASPCCTGPYSR